MRFAPRTPGVRQIFWSTGNAFGTFDTVERTLHVREGEVHLTSVELFGERVA
jgi:hypothetical protein